MNPYTEIFAGDIHIIFLTELRNILTEITVPHNSSLLYSIKKALFTASDSLVPALFKPETGRLVKTSHI
jgi:hypothetical protein